MHHCKCSDIFLWWHCMWSEVDIAPPYWKVGTKNYLYGPLLIKITTLFKINMVFDMEFFFFFSIFFPRCCCDLWWSFPLFIPLSVPFLFISIKSESYNSTLVFQYNLKNQSIMLIASIHIGLYDFSENVIKTSCAISLSLCRSYTPR